MKAEENNNEQYYQLIQQYNQQKKQLQLTIEKFRIELTKAKPDTLRELERFFTEIEKNND